MKIRGYTDLALLGSGGFSRVYKAHQPRFGRDVAIKVLLFDIDDPAAIRSFERESRAMGRVSAHPNIVTVFDNGITDDGHLYIVMEYLEGGTYNDRLNQATEMPVQEILEVGVKVASALATSHRQNILHRDLKPENIFISGYGEPRLGDFGISTVDRERTSTGTSGLTVHFAPPEVIDGHTATVRSDVYSLGATLWALLQGRKPFYKQTDQSIVTTAVRILAEDPEPIARTDCPPELSALIRGMMAKDQENRPTDALSVANALREIQTRLGLTPTPIALQRGPDDSDPTVPAAPPMPDSTSFSAFCRDCGTGLVREAQFCPGCGGAVTWPQPVAAAVAAAKAGKQAVPAADNSKLAWAAAAIVGVAVLAGGAFLLTRGNGSSPPSDEDLNTSATALVTVADGGELLMDEGSIVFPPTSLERDTEVAAELLDLAHDRLPGRSMIDVGPAVAADLTDVQLAVPATVSASIGEDTGFEAPGIVFGQETELGWEFVAATYDPDTGVASAIVSHFDWWNPFSWCFSCFFDEASQTIGKLLGNRIDPPQCPDDPPDWVNGFNSESIASAPLTGCVESEEGVLAVRLANNRPYGVVVTSPVPFAWAVVDNPLPLNDKGHEAFGSRIVGAQDWVYIPASSYAHVGIADPGETRFIELEASLNVFTTIVDVLLLALDEFAGDTVDDESAAVFVTGLAIECFGLPVINESAPDSLDDVVGVVQSLGSCLTDIEVREAGDLLGTFELSAEQATSLTLAKGFFAGLDAARYGGLAGDLFTDWIVNSQSGLPSVGLLTTTAEDEAAGGSAPSIDELASAEIPAMCGHDAAQLVGGKDVTLSVNEGEFELLGELGSGNPSWAVVPSSDGFLTAVVARCNAGGVGWPNPILLFGSGPEFYATSFLSEFDWGSVGLDAPGRNGIERIWVEGDRLMVDLSMYVTDDARCCPSASAVVALQPMGGELKLVEIVAYSIPIPTTTTLPPGADTLCGVRTVRAWLETDRYDAAICGEVGSTEYVARSRETGDGIELPACAVDDYMWVADNNGYRYEVDMWVDGIPTLRVYDPEGELLASEQARLVSGVLQYEYGLGPEGVYCEG